MMNGNDSSLPPYPHWYNNEDKGEGRYQNHSSDERKVSRLMRDTSLWKIYSPFKTLLHTISNVEAIRVIRKHPIYLTGTPENLVRLRAHKIDAFAIKVLCLLNINFTFPSQNNIIFPNVANFLTKIFKAINL